MSKWILKCPDCGSEEMSYFIPMKKGTCIEPTGPGFWTCKKCGWKEKRVRKSRAELNKLTDDMLKEVRRIYGPCFPPCLICGSESDFAILPKGIQSIDIPFLEDLKRIVTFQGAFPSGAWFCKKHSNKEIDDFAKKKGVNLKLTDKRD